jgi:hypothetical protein
MRVSSILYGIGASFLAAGIIAEVQEFKKRQQTWQKATLDGDGSSSSQSSQQQQPSQQTE